MSKTKGYLAAGKKKEFYDSVFQTLQEYLGDKFHLASHSITISVVDEILKDKSLPQDILNQLKSVFSDCDMARFSSSELRHEDMKDTFLKLQRAIDFLEKHKVL